MEFYRNVSMTLSNIKDIFIKKWVYAQVRATSESQFKKVFKTIFVP